MLERHNPPLPSRSLDSSRELRRMQTDAERVLWFHLRARRMHGIKFRRQHPLPPYVLDFYSEAAGLVIELDGSQHTADADAARTAFLVRKSLKVLRFWDNDVLTNLAAVLEEISSVLRGRTLTPTPLPVGEGL